MARPRTRTELISAATLEFERLWAAVDTVPEDRREVPGACEDWSVKDVLAHLHAWQEMALSWEAEGSRGGSPAIPAEGYTFAETPALNAAIHERTSGDDWDEVCARLRATHAQLLAVITTYTHDDLFEKGRFAWTKSTSVGSYLVSATSSHYAWATKLVRSFVRATVAV